MKNLVFSILLLVMVMSVNCYAQNSPAQTLPKALFSHGNHKPIASKDTVIESDTSKENKEPHYFYQSVNANILVNTKGGAAKRFSPAIEFGRTYGIFDIGLAGGRTNSFSSGSDTSRYLEFRPTINVFSAGRLAEGLCLGAGYVFGAKQALITEICNSINFNISTNVAVAITQGYYFFDGTNDNRSTQFIGLAFTYIFRSHIV